MLERAGHGWGRAATDATFRGSYPANSVVPHRGSSTRLRPRRCVVVWWRGGVVVCWREIELLTLHPHLVGARLTEPGRDGEIRRSPAGPIRDKGAPLQTLRVCVRPPGDGAALPPPVASPSTARRWSRRRVPPSRTLLGHPARVDRAVAQRGPVPAGGALGSAAEEERSPLGSPLPWGLAGDAAKRVALQRPQALSSPPVPGGCGKA